MRQTEADGFLCNLRNASGETWVEPRTILSPENESANNAANAADASESSRAECPPPLTSDVVGLVRKDGWDRAVNANDSNAQPEVLDPWLPDKAHDGDAHD
jgi:hypothetical protein